MARYGMKTGWKIFWVIMIILLIAAAVFLLTALICATIHNITFVEQIKNWFGIAKVTVDSLPKDDTATTMLNIFRK